MPPMMPALPGDPERIGPYRVLGRLGAGGMGTVYAAIDSCGRRVAVKVVHPQHAGDSDFRARFVREVEVLRRVGGPCLVPLLDAAPEADVPWLATRYVSGSTLQQHVTARGPLEGTQLHLFAAGVAGALAAIHSADVVHRDLKPTNVILAPQGPRVLDFGIAHLAEGTAITRTGVVSGTPGWISPEYYRNGTVGPAGDVFAWGALVAYAASGRLPFGGGAPDVVAFRVMSGEPELSGVPEELRGLVESCMSKSTGGRPTADSVAEHTAELLGRQETQVLGPVRDEVTLLQDVMLGQWQTSDGENDQDWVTSAVSKRRRRSVVLAVATAAVLVAGTGSGYLIRQAAAPETGSVDGRVLEADSPDRGEKSTPAEQPSSSQPTTGRVPSPSFEHSPSASLSRTRVHAIAPWTLGGRPADDITVTGTTVGSCWTSSEATMRLDAWRCLAEDEILDPCFSPDASPDHEAVLCMGTEVDRMVRLTLTEPLPGNNAHIPGGPQVTPLSIVLADGRTCRPMTGATMVLAGERMNYVCETGGHLYGQPDKTEALWTISYRGDGAASGVSMPIADAYH